MNTEAVKQKIAEAEKQLTEAKAELEELERQKPWEPEICGSYYTIGCIRYGVLLSARRDEEVYQARKALGLVFQTREEVQQHLDRWQARVRIEQRIAELDCGKGLGLVRHFVANYGDTLTAVWEDVSTTQPPALCGTEETIKQVIREHEDDYKIYFGVE